MDFLWLSVGECMCAHTFVTVEMFSGELTFLSLLECVCVCMQGVFVQKLITGQIGVLLFFLFL